MKWILLIIIIIILIVLNKYYSYNIPKIIWCHWDNEQLPEQIKKIYNHNCRILKGWTIRRLSTQKFLSICPVNELPNNFNDLIIQHKADFMRLWLLNKYGGVWLDISTVLNQSIDSIYEQCVNKKAELAGFYIELKTADMRYPVFENWFIMAPTNSRIIKFWYKEYYEAINIGLKKYRQRLNSSNIILHNLTQDNESVYFTQHYCYQVVIQNINEPRILQWRAEDSMFALQKRCWRGIYEADTNCLKQLFTTDNINSVPWIKLTGGDRPYFDHTLLENNS